MATLSDDPLFFCVLFFNTRMALCCQRQAGETSVEIEINPWNDELVSLTEQQLI